jgi:hypothetical protein
MKIIRIDTAFDTKFGESKVEELLEQGYTVTGRFCPDRYLVVVLEKLPEKSK